MTGIGSQFAGTVTVTFAANGCSVTEDDTLTLAGTGLTLVAASPSTSPSPSPASGPAIPTPEANAPAWFLQGCYQKQNDAIQDIIQNFQSSATDLLSAGQATVSLDVGEAGTLSGVLAFDGSSGSGGAIAYRPGVAPMTLLDSGGGLPANSCSDPCIFAFDGSGSSGSAIAYHPGGASNFVHDDSAADCDHGSGPGPPPIPPPITSSPPTATPTFGDDRSGHGHEIPTVLLADVLTAASPSPVAVGTEVAAGQTTYPSGGNHTLALRLSAAGRTLLEQVKAEDAAYWAATPSGISPPYALMTLTLSFTPAAPAAGGLPIVVWWGLLVVIVVAVIAVVLWRRRRVHPGTV